MVGVTLEMADKDMKVYFMAIDKCKIPPQGHSRGRRPDGVDHPARQARWQGLEVRRRRVGRG